MAAQRLRRILGLPIRGLDLLLRRIYGIRPFSDDPRCLIRMAAGFSDRNVPLSDGVAVVPGDAVVKMHLWNERLPRIPRGGADLAWGHEAHRRTLASLAMLAEELEQSRWSRVKAVHAELTVAGQRQAWLWSRMMGRYGFDVFEPGAAAGWPARARRLGEDLLAWALTWVFNAASLRGRPLRRNRLSCWISRRRLLEMHGRGVGQPGGRQPSNLTAPTRN
jgi:hypothetical protein